MHTMRKFIHTMSVVVLGFTAAMHGQRVKTLLTEPLPEAPGREIEVITVLYAPGEVDAIHRHDAHAVVYVLEGEVEMQVRGGGRCRGWVPGRFFTNRPKMSIR